MDDIAHTDLGALGRTELTAPERTATPPAPARTPNWRSRIVSKRAFQVLGVLALAVLVAVIAYRSLTRATAVRVGSVVVGTVREETIGPGTVQSRYSVSCGSRVAGTIDRVLVDVGDEVKQGQLLATLDRTELDARSRSSRGAVASAQQDVALAKANLAKTRSDLDFARIKDERTRYLVARGAISVAEADDARGLLLGDEANESAAVATVDARKAALARLGQEQRVSETILSYTSIYSPMAGVVTRRALEPGSAVAPGAVVFQIVDANALWVATLIDQSLVGRVTLGQHAVIHLRSGADVPGRVARIGFEADPVTRELEIDVAFDARPSRFAINEEADVTLLGEPAQGVTVPLEALVHGPDGAAVYVVEDGRAHRRLVRIGIGGATRAQVLEGLRVGESVSLTPSTVRDGQRVTAVGGG
jgi:RND family efflux transporter MFP subunit